jgi:DnaJ-class molecular chaperone
MQKKNTSLFERLTAARTTLGLAEEATQDEIKSAFRDLIQRWHPDKTNGDNDADAEKAREIIAAYKTIMDYCKKYKISFSKETAHRYRSPEEVWWEQFGNDPLWGGGRNS